MAWAVFFIEVMPSGRSCNQPIWGALCHLWSHFHGCMGVFSIKWSHFVRNLGKNLEKGPKIASGGLHMGQFFMMNEHVYPGH
jgi:hypothetical protein